MEKRSPADRAGVRVGEFLTAVNGHGIVDVLDYKFYTYDPVLELTLRGADGQERHVKVRKREGEELGVEFETYLMDKARCCANRCIFCFVDQMPAGMRDTLYFKDDDARLSFLMGNYITMTNLSDREVQRIIDLRISPLNISVHATDPQVRAMLLGSRRKDRGYELMQRFAAGGVTMNCQVVSCPGLNDGAVLEKTMTDLAALYPRVNSVSIVPVGLTRYREGLCDLKPYTRDQAAAVVDQVEAYGRTCLEKLGSTVFWCSDEFYLLAGRDLPQDEYYEDYTQLENGVGMLRLLETEFLAALKTEDPQPAPGRFSIATGVSAAPYIRALMDRAGESCGGLACTVYPIVNRFFGETIVVAGLVTGRDLIAQLKGRDLGERLLIPVNMLRHGQDVFLDDVTLAQASQELGVPLVPVNQDGFELFDTVFFLNGKGGPDGIKL